VSIAFCILAVLSIISAIGVVFARNAIYSALNLTANLMIMSLVYLSMSLQFLGVAQLIIYAGAIMVVFLFSVTVLAPDEELSLNLTDTTRLTGISVGTLIGACLLATIASAPIQMMKGSLAPSSLRDIAQNLFGRFVLPFECTAFVLLVALVGAALLGHRRLKPSGPPRKEAA